MWQFGEHQVMAAGQTPALLKQTKNNQQDSEPDMLKTATSMMLVSLLLLQTACQAPPARNSEEYVFNKWVDNQRQQCRQLPEPLATSCLSDTAKLDYQDFVKQRAAKP